MNSCNGGKKRENGVGGAPREGNLANRPRMTRGKKVLGNNARLESKATRRQPGNEKTPLEAGNRSFRLQPR